MHKFSAGSCYRAQTKRSITEMVEEDIAVKKIANVTSQFAGYRLECHRTKDFSTDVQFYLRLAIAVALKKYPNHFNRVVDFNLQHTIRYLQNLNTVSRD